MAPLGRRVSATATARVKNDDADESEAERKDGVEDTGPEGFYIKVGQSVSRVSTPDAEGTN